MDKKISSTEYKKRIITEGLLCPRETIWIRASDQAVAAAWFSAGDNRFRLDVRYSDGTISIYREYENVPYNIIKIAENVAFASEENEKIGKEKMMTDRQLKDICIDKLDERCGLHVQEKTIDCDTIILGIENCLKTTCWKCPYLNESRCRYVVLEEALFMLKHLHEKEKIKND